MALYKNQNVLGQSPSEAFDAIHTPGVAAPYAGIYRCVKCNHEIGIAEGHILPAQNHAQHPANLGPIQWKLAVYAQHNK